MQVQCFHTDKNYYKRNFGKSILLWENINLLFFDLYFVLMTASLREQADWGNFGNVWTFSLCGPSPLRSPLPPTLACLFWRSGLSWTPGSRSTDAPAGAGSFSACCLRLASNGLRTLHLWMEKSERIHTHSTIHKRQAYQYLLLILKYDCAISVEDTSQLPFSSWLFLKKRINGIYNAFVWRNKIHVIGLNRKILNQQNHYSIRGLLL